jgi:hypothetical protein
MRFNGAGEAAIGSSRLAGAPAAHIIQVPNIWIGVVSSQ